MISGSHIDGQANTFACLLPDYIWHILRWIKTGIGIPWTYFCRVWNRYRIPKTTRKTVWQPIVISDYRHFFDYESHMPPTSFAHWGFVVQKLIKEIGAQPCSHWSHAELGAAACPSLGLKLHNSNCTMSKPFKQNKPGCDLPDRHVQLRPMRVTDNRWLWSRTDTICLETICLQILAGVHTGVFCCDYLPSETTADLSLDLHL